VDREISIRCGAIVNAAGPWAHSVLRRIEPKQQEVPIELVQGSHLELPGIMTHGCYYMESPRDGRAVFVMPWKGHILLGTTERAFAGDPSQVSATADERDYLLEVYRRMFPRGETEILDAWAGLRVLPASPSRSAFRRSRETRLVPDSNRPHRLVSIFGGKLTGYRVTAERVLAMLQPALPRRTRRALTEELPLRLSPAASKST
jgi:glycerol-3-phosphate dehydrogenase